MSPKKKNNIFCTTKNLCLISLLLFGHKFFAQSNFFNTDDKLEKEFKSIICTLSDSSMGGRYAGSVYEIRAIEFLKNFLNDCKQTYVVKTDTFSYCCRNDSVVTAHNLWFYPRNSTQKKIFLTAHYDHLPPNSQYSKEIWNKDKIHHGADDNASGVAMAVILFKYLNTLPTDFQPVLILFSGHEEGLHGSEYWVQNNSISNDSVVLLVNFDMVGRLSEETNIISIHINDENIYKDTLMKIQSDINPVLTFERLNETDANGFLDVNISSLSVSTGIHADYHRISDTADKINYKGMVKIFNFMTNFLGML